MAAARPKTTIATFTCGNATATATVPGSDFSDKDIDHAIYSTNQVLAMLVELKAARPETHAEAPST